MYPYERVVNCYQQPERSLIEALRLLVFGVLVNPMPAAIYDLAWSTPGIAGDERKAWFESAFDLIYLPIGDDEFVVTLNPAWFVAYNEAVEAGEVSITAPCPCLSF